MNNTATFQGFSAPNYTQVPDELFDDLMTDLSGAELKVLLYIIRRTFGFKKTEDTISLSQMLNGITTKGRYTITIVSPASYTFKSEVANPNGGWATVMEGKATRTQ